MKGYVKRPIDLLNGKTGTAYVLEKFAAKFDKIADRPLERIHLAHKIVDKDGKIIKNM